MLGAEDVQAGFDRAVDQIKALGVRFDESKLNLELDENLMPVLEEEDEELPAVEGHEFESTLAIVQGIADALEAREKEAKEKRKMAAEARRAEIAPLDVAPLAMAVPGDESVANPSVDGPLPATIVEEPPPAAVVEEPPLAVAVEEPPFAAAGLNSENPPDSVIDVDEIAPDV